MKKSAQGFRTIDVVLGALAAAAAVQFFPSEAFAAATFLTDAASKVMDVWSVVKTTIFVVAAMGLAICGVFAFMGRFKWSHFFAIAGGVFLVAMGNELVIWLGGGSVSGGVTY